MDVPLSVMMGTRGLSLPSDAGSTTGHHTEGCHLPGSGKVEDSTTEQMLLPPVDPAHMAQTLAWLSQGAEESTTSQNRQLFDQDAQTLPTTPTRDQGEVSFEVEASVEASVACVHRFFSKVPAEVSAQDSSWEVSAFQDYTLLAFDMKIEEASLEQKKTVVRLQKPCQGDVVRFYNLVDQLKATLFSEFGMNDSLHSAVLEDEEDDFDDFEMEDENDEDVWSERISSVMKAVSSRSSALREEAFQVLARWAETDARKVSLAQAFLAKQDVLVQLLQAASLCPLAELYPLVAAFKSITGSHEASALLGNVFSDVIAEAAKDSSIPELIHRELRAAGSNIGLQG
mmetsp:Transcript_27364/g.63852  ORF Transcript_27364/g.63852 Transcript_27364/m.63852 type:complete len:342 (+) Transcript_27364:122-1147(+)|eukprot:CAMPEP_0178431870 /NCGR_PEP_ID=MMETSP0689_2-20121128/32086_1 /TAXON_ID=160604 /ORGANISM="Amphidinium massartii, Strain CS-259" /LENGTH=341 /DNA_ID=CAMNT_0020053827 /DNA_START=38 /DNA_END=1063 /DNA_ORIENTATION=+